MVLAASSHKPDSLLDWLSISWFLPAGFKADRVYETSDAIVVLGQEEVLRFSKSRPENFARHWKNTRHEYLTAKKLAPTLFRGIRMLVWEDDRPRWMDATKSLPVSEGELAIVMRRVQEAETLQSLLPEKLQDGMGFAHRMASILAHLHRSGKPRREGYLFVKHIDKDFDCRIEGFLSRHGMHLDTLSRVALEEAKAFVNHFALTQSSRLLRRRKEGFVIDSHGDIRAGNIWLNEQTSQLEIFRHEPSGEGQKARDVLCDLASLSIDLRIYGADELAEAVEQAYAKQYPEAFDPRAYRFFLIREALKRSVEFDEEDLVLAEESQKGRFLRRMSSLLFWSLGPVMVVLDDSKHPSLPLARDLSDALCAELMTVDNVQFVHQAEPVLFERLLFRAQHRLRRGYSVVLLWNAPGREDYEALDRLRVPYVVIRLEQDGPSIARGSTRTLFQQDYQGDGVINGYALDQLAFEKWTEPSLGKTLLSPADLAPSEQIRTLLFDILVHAQRAAR